MAEKLFTLGEKWPQPNDFPAEENPFVRVNGAINSPAGAIDHCVGCFRG